MFFYDKFLLSKDFSLILKEETDCSMFCLQMCFSHNLSKTLQLLVKMITEIIADYKSTNNMFLHKTVNVCHLCSFGQMDRINCITFKFLN